MVNKKINSASLTKMKSLEITQKEKKKKKKEPKRNLFAKIRIYKAFKCLTIWLNLRNLNVLLLA